MSKLGSKERNYNVMRKGSGNLASAIGLYKSGMDLVKLRDARTLVESSMKAQSDKSSLTRATPSNVGSVLLIPEMQVQRTSSGFSTPQEQSLQINSLFKGKISEVDSSQSSNERHRLPINSESSLAKCKTFMNWEKAHRSKSKFYRGNRTRKTTTVDGRAVKSLISQIFDNNHRGNSRFLSSNRSVI